MAVAIDQHHGFKPFVRSHRRCKLQSFTDHLNFELTNLTNSLKHAVKYDDVNIHRSFSTPCLSLATQVEDNEFPRIEIVAGRGVPKVRALVAQVSISMASGVDPRPISSGLGGAYFLCTQNGNNIAVAKPIDEEPMACNNPKGFAGQMLGQPGLKRSIRVGETAIRELAAYLLDHGEFAGVPATALVKFSRVAFYHRVSNTAAPTNYKKIASLQRYVDHDFDAGELGPSGFSVSSVHRIGILDVRLLNLDRHAGNILVKKCNKTNACAYNAAEVAELVPIDHGLCLPEWLDDPYFEWLHWPQSSVPFSESEAEYISNLDPFKDAKLLRTELPFLRESSIRVLVVCTIFLKRAVAAGLCLADIGGMMTREFCGGEEDSSVLQNVCEEAYNQTTGMSKIFNEDDVQISDSKEEIGMFEFDDEFDEKSKIELGGLPVPELAKPPKIPRFLSASASVSGYASQEEKEYSCDSKSNYYEDEKCSKLTKSISFSGQNHNNNNNESRGGIYFDKMSEDEWESFLEDFEKLLPGVFENTKSFSFSLKQRLGTSCEY